jgi:hypothetical protein
MNLYLDSANLLGVGFCASNRPTGFARDIKSCIEAGMAILREF